MLLFLLFFWLFFLFFLFFSSSFVVAAFVCVCVYVCVCGGRGGGSLLFSCVFVVVIWFFDS